MGLYGTARDITERKAENFINFQAYHDLLTRLPNRALFKDSLAWPRPKADEINPNWRNVPGSGPVQGGQ